MFADKSVDIKFRPTFMIFLQQLRLLLAGVTVLYPGDPNMILLPALAIFLTLTALNTSMQPCLVWWINIFRSLLFSICTWSAACSLALVNGLARPMCWAALSAGEASE